ncbi:MAG: hypothetical protein NXI04_19300 [Planctomycetaceae bacterium]|nr:hypothetical protein [Planctomycetaceae bacterium]
MTDEDLESLAEIVNIGVGRAASSLSILLGSAIELKVPKVRVIAASDRVLDQVDGISVKQQFTGAVAGKALLQFPTQTGRQLACLLTGYDELDEIPEFEISGVLAEVGNIVLNGVLGSLANITSSHLDYTVPEFYVGRAVSDLIGSAVPSSRSGSVLIADTDFCVSSEGIHGSIMIAFEIGALESLVEYLQQLVA